MNGLAWLIWTLLLVAGWVLLAAHYRTGDERYWGLSGACFGAALGLAVGVIVT